MKGIYVECPKCSGTGIESIKSPVVGGGEETTEVICRRCTGDGSVSLSGLSDDLITFLTDLKGVVDDIKNKCDDIFEQVS